MPPSSSPSRDRALRCRRCAERLDATHRANCDLGPGPVLEGDTTPHIIWQDPGLDRAPLEDLEP